MTGLWGKARKGDANKSSKMNKSSQARPTIDDQLYSSLTPCVTNGVININEIILLLYFVVGSFFVPNR